ncbi:MAG: tetratricopeptide repeat protein [Acidobacteriota bacterium]
MRTILFGIALSVATGSAFAACDELQQAPERVRQERITGSLAKAEAMAREALACSEVSPGVALELNIELARTLRRAALHRNDRSAKDALAVLEAAASLVAEDDRRGRATLDLALSDYHSGAELAQREFPQASRLAERARTAFAELGDAVGLTDATHRLGMIAFQRRELDKARTLIEESLTVSKRGPERPLFLGDYHRHLGFVLYVSEDLEGALPHFQKSLEYRLKANSRDASMFAYNMLGRALIAADRPAEAREPLEQALEIARQLPSPAGELRVTLNLGRLHEALQDRSSALAAFTKARDLAQRLESESYAKTATEAIDRLTAEDRD